VKLYRTSNGAVVEADGQFHLLTELRSPQDWDRVLCDSELHARARAATAKSPMRIDPENILAPIVSQEVWAAGVTYYSSRKARIEESRSAGRGDFCDRLRSGSSRIVLQSDWTTRGRPWTSSAHPFRRPLVGT